MSDYWSNLVLISATAVLVLSVFGMSAAAGFWIADGKYLRGWVAAVACAVAFVLSAAYVGTFAGGAA